VFNKDSLERWARNYDITFSLSEDAPSAAPVDAGDDSLLAAMKRGGLVTDVHGDTVEQVLKYASQCVPGLTDSEKELLFTRLMERETLTSTGIGKGVAIPHPRNPLPGDKRAVIVTCFLQHGIDFKALDNQPVTVLFVIVCPTIKTHLSLLSQISHCLRDNSFIDLLNSSPGPDEFFDRVSDYQKDLDKVR
jgi:PTS system nitrogen regulatory IIA component